MLNWLMKIREIGLTVAILLCSFSFTSTAHSQCSDQDYVAVFVLSGLQPDFISLQTEMLSVTPVGPSTFPPESDIFNNIMYSFQGDDVFPNISPGELVGNIWSWYGSGHTQALVDQRDGFVLFSGTVVWMGQGSIHFPISSSHDWAFLPMNPAPAPVSVGVINNPIWGMAGLPTTQDLTTLAVEYLRTTDVFHSFGDCGDYVVTGWIYTPAIGGLDPGSAKLIITVEGKVGAPWNGELVPTAMTSWDSLKANYR